MSRSATSYRIYFGTSRKYPLGEQSGIVLRECCQLIGCGKIHAQGLVAHGHIPWT